MGRSRNSSTIFFIYFILLGTQDDQRKPLGYPQVALRVWSNGWAAADFADNFLGCAGKPPGHLRRFSCKRWVLTTVSPS